jgi:hypothetical protein
MKSLVVNSGVEVLDKDVAGTSFAKRGIPLRPHDTTRTILDQSVVEIVKCFLTYY